MLLILVFLLCVIAATLLTATMEAVRNKKPTMIHLVGPLVTKMLDTLKLSIAWPGKPTKNEGSQYRGSAHQLLLLAAAQKSVK